MLNAQVCAQAGIKPSQVAYVEAHGTGTVVGDAQELGALEEFYAIKGEHTPEEPLLIGSVKSNMGHCEGCSGLAGVRPSCSHPNLICIFPKLASCLSERSSLHYNAYHFAM